MADKTLKPGRPARPFDEADATAGLKGKAVLVPSSALPTLEQAHGPRIYLHGVIKVFLSVEKKLRHCYVCVRRVYAVSAASVMYVLAACVLSVRLLALLEHPVA